MTIAAKSLKHALKHCLNQPHARLQHLTRMMLLAAIIVLASCDSEPAIELPITLEPGQLAKGEDEYGTFYTYVPTTLPENGEILLVIHGTPLKDQTEEWNAEYYATKWIDFAEEQGLVLVVPVFNQEDFSSRLGDHALSGYRGLFGREIGADEWVLRLVNGHQQQLGSANEQFYLYGHSAGGQFTARFLVTHPETVKKAVITAAATYPQPTTEVAWPFGMGELHTDIEWDADTVQPVDIVPDKQKWLAATQVPLTVIVGLDDRAGLPPSLLPGQKGGNRLFIAKNWVEDMATFAEANGLTSHFTFDIIAGKGHTMSGLLAFSQEALLPEQDSAN
jgi:hypothetical protein